jgi:hypothetical protein
VLQTGQLLLDAAQLLCHFVSSLHPNGRQLSLLLDLPNLGQNRYWCLALNAKHSALGFEAILVELSEPLLCFLEGKGEVF